MPRTLARILLLPALLLVLVFTSSCDKNPTGPQQTIIGQWRVLSYDYTVFVNDVPYTDYYYTMTYVDDVYSIMLFVIDSDYFWIYENSPCEDSFSAGSSSYSTSDHTISTGTQDWEYEFQDDYLLLTTEYSETSENITVREVVTFTLATYSGEVPPSEWGTALVDDGYEEDDDGAHASTIYVDAAAQAHVLMPADEDWFAFDTVEVHKYLIETTGNTDTVILLYAADGVTSLGISDDDSGMSLNARIEWYAPATDTFHFKVVGWDESEGGRYSIRVTDITP